MEVKITGIDMSAAFDTIRRDRLLDILNNILEEDEVRIIRFLLSDTKINIRVDGATIEKPFTTNVGTPQGDGLSPVLFIIYLEHALREVRPSIQQNIQMPMSEIAYADDVDFVDSDFIDVNKVQNILERHNLFVNSDKTERTTVTEANDEWRKVKKVGSLLGSKEDIKNRKHLATIAMNKLMQVWIRKDKLKTKTKVKLYNALVKSVLLYNCGTWALTKTEELKLDAFHRKQLRILLGIRYPTKISNSSLYNKCKESPLSTQILNSRWRLFGHVLRRDQNIPANLAMNFFFTNTSKRPIGRPPTTLPSTLHNDLSKTNLGLELKTLEDLKTMQQIAQERIEWKFITSEIKRAAEAARSIDPGSERL